MIIKLFSGKVHEKALKLHAIASLNVTSTPSNENHNDANQVNQNHDIKNGTVPAISNGQVPAGANGNAANGTDGVPVRSPSANTDGSTVGSDQDCITTRDVIVNNEDMADDSSQGAGSKVRAQEPAAIFDLLVPHHSKCVTFDLTESDIHTNVVTCLENTL